MIFFQVVQRRPGLNNSATGAAENHIMIAVLEVYPQMPGKDSKGIYKRT